MGASRQGSRAFLQLQGCGRILLLRVRFTVFYFRPVHGSHRCSLQWPVSPPLFPSLSPQEPPQPWARLRRTWHRACTNISGGCEFMPDGKEIIVEALLCSSLQTSNRTRSSPRMSTSSLFCCTQRSAARFNLSVNGLMWRLGRLWTDAIMMFACRPKRVWPASALHSVSSPGFHAGQSALSRTQALQKELSCLLCCVRFGVKDCLKKWAGASRDICFSFGGECFNLISVPAIRLANEALGWTY